MGIFTIVAMFPLLRSLGPLPKTTLQHTDWRSGSYVVDQTGRRVQVGDLAVGSIETVFPEGTENTDRGQAVDQTVLIRVSNEAFTTMKGRESLGAARLRRVLQGLHAPRLPGRTLRARVAVARVSVSPVDVQRDQRRRPAVRSGAATIAAAAALRRRRGLPAEPKRLPRSGRSGILGALVSDVINTKRAKKQALGPYGRSASLSMNSTTAWASRAAGARSWTRSSPTTGRSCSVRSRSTRS